MRLLPRTTAKPALWMLPRQNRINRPVGRGRESTRGQSTLTSEDPRTVVCDRGPRRRPGR